MNRTVNEDSATTPSPVESDTNPSLESDVLTDGAEISYGD
jgi:hypothetical protein